MRNFLVFLVVGTGGFVVDAGITHLMLHWGYPPEISRLPAISCAILLTWLANRALTYKVTAPKSAGELLRYVVAALLLSGVNYAGFLFFVGLNLHTLLALLLATLLQVALSFHVYRTLVFKTQNT